jgi:hypothetical protein
MIDFPQMVSTSHINAEYYFDRDVNCVRSFFKRRYGFVASEWPRLGTDIDRGQASSSLDEELRASGWTEAYNEDLSRLMGMAEEEEAAARARGETGADDDSDEGDDWNRDEDEEQEEEEEDDDEAEKEEEAKEEAEYGLEPAANNRAFRSGIFNKNASSEVIASAVSEAAAAGGQAVVGAGSSKKADAAAAARRAELAELAELARLAAETTLAAGGAEGGAAAGAGGAGAEGAAAKKDEPSTAGPDAKPDAKPDAGLDAGPSSSVAAGGSPAADGGPQLVDLSAGNVALPTLPLSARRPAGPGSVAGSAVGSVCSARALEAKDRIKAELKKGRAPVSKRSQNEGKDREMRKTKLQMKRDVQGGFFS